MLELFGLLPPLHATPYPKCDPLAQHRLTDAEETFPPIEETLRDGIGSFTYMRLNYILFVTPL